jgi:hypothetical protein
MSISVQCAACTVELKVRDAFVGHRLDCPRCGADLGVIAAAAPAVAPTRPAAKSRLRLWLIIAMSAMALAGFGYWILWLPSSSQDEAFRDYLKTLDALAQAQLDQPNDAALEKDLPRLLELAKHAAELKARVEVFPERAKTQLLERYKTENKAAWDKQEAVFHSVFMQGRRVGVVYFKRNGQKAGWVEVTPSKPIGLP